MLVPSLQRASIVMEESASSVCEVIRASSMHKAKQACVLRMVSMLARLLSQSVALGLST